MKRPLISAIIVTYNRVDIVVNCIESLLKQSYDNMEIIVVDNHSTDQSVELIREFCEDKKVGDKVRVVDSDVNLMNAGGRNLGIRYAKGDYLLFVDSDNILDHEAVRIMLKDLMNHQKIASVTALTIQNDDRSTQQLYRRISLYTSMAHSRNCDYEKEMPTKCVYTECCENVFMVRREVIDLIGYFDKSYYIMYEEADFCERIRRKGYRHITDPKAKTVHYRAMGNDEQSELRALGIGFPARAFYFARNRTVYMRKYANALGLVLYYLLFQHLFMCYYCYKAISYRRYDIAKEYLRGYMQSMFMKVDRDSYVSFDGAENENEG